MNMKYPEKYRVQGEYNHAGIFLIKHNKISDYIFYVIASDGMGWEHVSVTLKKSLSKYRLKDVKRCCTWEEMCYLKDIFWEDSETVIQFHPPKKEHISMHEYCLHLWKPTDYEIKTPPSILVGLKS